jgi:hypothetical protein
MPRVGFRQRHVARDLRSPATVGAGGCA